MTPELIAKMFDVKVNDNIRSVSEGLKVGMATAGLDKPHRLAHYLPQLGHESMSFRYDREIWGPTPAQARYDTRTDLGNTPERDGDGKLYAGRTAIQVTGKANYTAFTAWLIKRFPKMKVPDFVKTPDLLNTDPWEGLAPIWFWEVNKLNRWADMNDIKMVTKVINGGYNGLDDRMKRYPRAALVLLGEDPRDVRGFQKSAGLFVDGDAGPMTCAAMHKALLKLPPLLVA